MVTRETLTTIRTTIEVTPIIITEAVLTITDRLHRRGVIALLLQREVLPGQDTAVLVLQAEGAVLTAQVQVLEVLVQQRPEVAQVLEVVQALAQVQEVEGEDKD